MEKDEKIDTKLQILHYKNSKLFNLMNEKMSSIYKSNENKKVYSEKKREKEKE